jgi:hypothetical protein
MAITRSGVTCGGWPVKGDPDGHCWTHSAALADRRKAGQRRGGQVSTLRHRALVGLLNPDDPKSANRFRFGMIADCMRPGGMASQKVRDLSAVLADWEGSQKLADLAAEVAVLAQAVAALGRERGAGA